VGAHVAAVGGRVREQVAEVDPVEREEPHPRIHDPDHDAHAQHDDAEPDGPLPAGPFRRGGVRPGPLRPVPRGVDILRARLVHDLTACQPGCRDRLHLLMDD
jgi:hypothetical protein